MKLNKFYAILILVLVVASACRKEAPLVKSEIGLIKTAVFNDENKDGAAQIGETITYNFQITNTGEATISNLRIEDTKFGNDAIVPTKTTLKKGERTIHTLSYTLTTADISAGEVVNQAKVFGKDDNGTLISDLSDDNSNDEDDKTVTVFNRPYDGGLFIINEGPFSSGGGTISFVNKDFSNIEHEVYKTVNNEALGSVLQSMTISGDYAYIIVNNSHKLVIANRYTMQKVGAIEYGKGLLNPRYIAVADGKAYVSNWGESLDSTDDFIAVINLSDYSISKKIPVGLGPEKMTIVNNKLYVAMKGAWDYNNMVEVIDITNDTKIDTIEVGDVPNSLVVTNDDIYVLCSGKPSYSGSETGGSIYRIKTSTDNASKIVSFDSKVHPIFLNQSNNDFYYFNGGKVYKWDGTSTIPSMAETGLDGYYYGMDINDGKLFTFDAKDYSSNGEMKVFDLTSNSLSYTFTTGIIPNAAVFN